MHVSRKHELAEELDAFLARFDDRFRRSDTRQHPGRDVRGQMADLDAKSVEPTTCALGSGPHAAGVSGPAPLGRGQRPQPRRGDRDLRKGRTERRRHDR